MEAKPGEMATSRQLLPSQISSEQTRSDRSPPKESPAEANTAKSNIDQSSIIRSLSCATITNTSTLVPLLHGRSLFCATITDTSTLPPLLRLPVQISKQILRYLLVADGVRICRHTTQPLLLVNKGHRPPGPFPYSGVSPEVLCVNRRLYLEGLTILYSENVFYFQKTFSVAGAGVHGIKTYLAKMSPVGRSLLRVAAFSVDLFSMNLAPQALGPHVEYPVLGCLGDVRAACQYLSDNLPNVQGLWVFLWESDGLAEHVVAAAGFPQFRLIWKKQLLELGIKQFFLSLSHFRGRMRVTVHGEMLGLVVGILLRNAFAQAVALDWTLNGLIKGCICPCWRQADSLTAWMAFTPQRNGERSGIAQAGNDGATTMSASTSLSRSTRPREAPEAPNTEELFSLLYRLRGSDRSAVSRRLAQF